MEKVLQQLLLNEEKFNAFAKLFFNDADIDNNHVIDANEFRQMIFSLCDELGLPMPNDDEIKILRNKVDLNHNGIIEFNEFKLFLKNLFKQIIENGINNLNH